MCVGLLVESLHLALHVPMPRLDAFESLAHFWTGQAEAPGTIHVQDWVTQ